MDNSPSWDEPLSVVPEVGNEHIERRDVATVAAAQRPTSREYRRYLGIVAALRAAGWDTERQSADSPFSVEDPAMTAITARAASDAAAAATVAGIDGGHVAAVGDAMRTGLDALWDDELGWYRPYDTLARRPVGPATSTGLVALWAGCADSRVQRMMERVDSWRASFPSPIPTSQPDDPSFDPIRYWRGPVWVLTNWLVADGLDQAGCTDRAAALRSDTRRLVERGLLGVLRPPVTPRASEVRGSHGAPRSRWRGSRTADPRRMSPPR